jgi:hypothetical protein
MRHRLQIVLTENEQELESLEVQVDEAQENERDVKRALAVMLNHQRGIFSRKQRSLEKSLEDHKRKHMYQELELVQDSANSGGWRFRAKARTTFEERMNLASKPAPGQRAKATFPGVATSSGGPEMLSAEESRLLSGSSGSSGNNSSSSRGGSTGTSMAESNTTGSDRKISVVSRAYQLQGDLADANAELVSG